MSYIDEIDAIMNDSPELSKPKGHIEEIDEIMRSSPVLLKTGTPENEEKQFSWPRFIAEKVSQGVLSLADMPQTAVEGVMDFFDPRVPLRNGSAEDMQYRKEHPYKPIVSSTVESLANKGGIDLHSQGEGNTPAQRIAGHAAQFAGGAAIPVGGAANVVKSAALGAGIGGLSGTLQEGNVPPLAADLASLATVLAASGAPKLASLFKNSGSLADAEKRVSTYLQGTLGEEGSLAAAKNIEGAPQYPLTGYEPTTAEVANTPALSQLHRLRQGAIGSGLPEHAGNQNIALNEASDILSAGKSTSQEIKDSIGKELSQRISKREEETGPLYEEVKKDNTQINPKNLKAFLKENSGVKGPKKDDLRNIRKLARPSEPLSPEEKALSRKYKEQKKAILMEGFGKESTKKALGQLEKPKKNHPTVADLDEARQNMNDRIEELGKQKNRVRQYKGAIRALDKDLEVAPKQAEATAKYAELSKPINEIAEHPVLSKLPESRSNEIMSKLYNDSSYDNMVSLKKVLKDQPEKWKGVQDATVEYLMKSIRNAGAEGKQNVLSYHKLSKFLEKHEKSLLEVFDKDQIQFLNELKNATKGRNIAQTLGKENESPTYAKLISGTHLHDGAVSKLSKGLDRVHAAPIPKFFKSTADGLRMMLNGYIKNKESDVMAVVDKVLKDKEYAHKLITHKFKTQSEFNKEINQIIKQSSSVISNTKDKD